MTIRQITMKCKKCNTKYTIRRPADDTLQVLVTEDNIEYCWLPTYGTNGLLDIAEKCKGIKDPYLNATSKDLLEIMKEISTYLDIPFNLYSPKIPEECLHCASTELLKFDETEIETDNLNICYLSTKLFEHG